MGNVTAFLGLETSILALSLLAWLLLVLLLLLLVVVVVVVLLLL